MTQQNHVIWEPPVPNPTLVKNEVHIWRIPLQQSQNIIEKCGRTLNPDEKKRAGRFRFERHRRRYIVCRGALRFILSEYLQNQSPSSFAFRYTKWNKPFLISDELSFNVSHSAEAALIALTTCGDLGVDIEKIRPISDMGDMVKNVFAMKEQRAWHTYDPEEQPQAFYAGWTRKEAVVKAIGQGLSIPLKSFSVDLAPTVERPDHSLPEWHVVSFWPQPEFIAAVVSSNPIKNITHYDWSLT